MVDENKEQEDDIKQACVDITDILDKRFTNKELALAVICKLAAINAVYIGQDSETIENIVDSMNEEISSIVASILGDLKNQNV
jgi:hypothetical protein